MWTEIQIVTLCRPKIWPKQASHLQHVFAIVFELKWEMSEREREREREGDRETE